MVHYEFHSWTSRPYLNAQDIEEHHLRISDLAMEEFDKMKKMGGEEYSSKYREQLRAEIEETFSQYKVMIEDIFDIKP